jgi:threonine/homoserine/homoserine lactone efflux protein
VREAVGQVLPLAVAVAISPLPIVAVVLMLVTPRGRTNGPAFVVGWIGGLAVLGAILLAIASGGDANDDNQPADWVSLVELVLGLALLLLSVQQWRGRPRGGEEAPVPKWMGTLDGFTATKSLAAGAVLSSVNPKNLLLAIAAAAEIAQTGISEGEQAAAWGVFVLVATAGVAVPVVIYFALGDRAGPVLGSLKGWMARNNRVIMAVLLLVLGAKLIGDGIGGL